MQITIREARMDELPILKAFEQGIILAERPFDSTLKEDPISYYDLSEFITSETATVVVAEADGILVGSGFADIRKAKDYYKHKTYAHLGFMYVSPEYRGKGINSKIMNALIAWSQEQGVNEIRLTVYPDNTSAIQAYEKVGFKAQLIEMRYTLSD